MVKIFAETHKIIASNIYDNVYEKYDLKLDKNRLLWWSIAPDILPQYKFVRHYKDESIDYIVKEIIKVIYVSRYVEFNTVLDPIAIKILSKKIGLISHYISDYFCLPHAKRWTFNVSKDVMIKHIKYESDLEEFSKTHTFNNNIVDFEDININNDVENLYDSIKSFIEDGLDLYLQNEGFANDLDFANIMNIKIANFILETIEEYSEAIYTQIAFEV
ncbi:MAG TPA: zinc dependent phospholipase C family protein [Tissierellaceae bacterium]